MPIVPREAPTTSPVTAFVRIRPLTSKEVDADDTELPTLCSEADDASTLPLLSSFTGVIGPAQNNAAVFDSCLAPKLSMVLRGGSVSIFSYGYTGGGKTHSVVGYGEERGLYYLAAEGLLRELDAATPAAGRDDESSPFLKVTACEIYGADQAFRTPLASLSAARARHTRASKRATNVHRLHGRSAHICDPPISAIRPPPR